MPQFAIIDLGTNTFNLLIGKSENSGHYQILVNKKIPVKLGEGGITKGEISAAAIQRGMEAISNYLQICSENRVELIKAYGTSAIRSSKNGRIFLDQIKELSGIEVQIITGDREAELIYLGVRQSLDIKDRNFLILDIGGGSNELIAANMEKILWKKSYPLGMARLLEKFCPGNPITTEEIGNIKRYLAHQMQDLFENIRLHKIDLLVGASGSFESFLYMIKNLELWQIQDLLRPQSEIISISDFENLYQKLIQSTTEERRKMKGLEEMRIEMIVLASLFVKFILENHPFESILQTNFALKEGAAAELLELN